MTVSIATRMEEVLTRRQLVRSLVASTIGSVVEWYDFFLYGFASALYIGPLFFPKGNPFLQTMAALATFAIGFVARPVGAVIFGHRGDRLGRKHVLISTLTLMGLATFLMGLVPTYAQIGLWGAVILVALRVLQGIGVGGEWAGAVLLPIEWGNKTGRRGFWGSFPQVGVSAGVALGLVALQLSTVYWLGVGSYWGWRIPFLASVVLLVLGLYIRLGILDTPVFTNLLEQRRIERMPVVAVLRRQWREVLLSCFLRTAEQAPSYLFTTFVLIYGVTVLKLPQSQLIMYLIIAATVSIGTVLLWGHLSDRVGRKRLFVIGILVMAAFASLYFMLLDTRVPLLVLVGIVFSLVVRDMLTGPQAAFIAESFTGRMRYSGASLGFHLASITAGGPAPLIATALYQTYHSSLPIVIYVWVCCAASLVAAVLLRNRSQQDLAVEYDEPLALPVPS